MKFPPFRLRHSAGGIDADAQLINRTFLAFILALTGYGVFSARFDFGEIARGLATIVVSPDILINDYTSHAGVGPAFVNSGLNALFALMLLRLSGVLISGPAIAALFTVAGFSLFGKNIYNIWPVVAGIAVYTRISGRPFKEIVIVALFGTALAPIVSEFTFSLGIPLPWNIPAGIAAGMFSGFILPPIARNALDFTRGYNLYNIGFSAGLVGTVVMSIMRAFRLELSGGFAWGSLPPETIVPFLVLYFAFMIAAGMVEDPQWLKGYREILGTPGRLVSDFARKQGIGATLVNMGSMGLLGVAYVFAIGGDWNGPMIGGIFAIVGFAAFGKHPLNALPPMLGVALAGSLTQYGLSSPTTQLAGLFVATLAPITGAYGVFAGLVAGMLHLCIVVNVGYLHGGLNLYNNGFSGGVVAGILVPVLQWIDDWRHHET